LYLFTAREKEKEIEFLGVHLLLPTHDTTIVPSILDNSYEKFELNVFKKLARGKSVIFDVGANIGLYSLVAADSTKDTAKIYAFEPIEENRYYLEENIRRNAYSNIRVVPMAVGERPGKLKIYLAKNSIGTHSVGRETNDSVTVGKTTIDSFSKKNAVIPDIVKIDIEGYESYAIAGAKRTIKENRPVLFIEFDTKLIHNCGSDPDKLAADLFEMYAYRYLLDEKAGILKPLADTAILHKTSNINLVLSANKITL
jgi:FkbM family methyltransferase